MPEEPVDAFGDHAFFEEFGVVYLGRANQENHKADDYQNYANREEGMGGQDKIDQPRELGIAAEHLDVHDRAVKEPGKGQEHPDRFQDDKEGGDFQQDIRQPG